MNNIKSFIFHPSACWARRGIVVHSVRRRLRRHRKQLSGYYTNMMQQIEFIIPTNIQPLWQFFFTQGLGHR